MSTLGFSVASALTEGNNKRDLLKGTFSFGDVDALSLSFRELTAGQQFSLEFNKVFFCSVNVPTLIQLTVGDETVEFTLNASSLLLPFAGSVVIRNENQGLDIPVVVRYVTA